MRCCVTMLCFLLVFLSSCEARKGRKSSRTSAALLRSESGGSPEEMPARNESRNTDVQNSNGRSYELDTRVQSGVAAESANSHVQEAGPRKRKRKRKGNGKKSRSNRKSKPSAEDSTDANRKELLRSTMRRMFGFDHMITPRTTTGTSDTIDAHVARMTSAQSSSGSRRRNRPRKTNDNNERTIPNPPDFMLELYRTYSEDESLVLLHSKSQGNTIRSFFSVAGDAPDRLQDKGKPMIIAPFLPPTGQPRTTEDEANDFNPNQSQMRVFAFNLTSIPATESIMAAELRLDGYRSAVLDVARNGQSHNSSTWSAVISVYKIAESEQQDGRNVYKRVARLVTIRPTSRFSWVDANLARLASRARPLGRLLIVKFNQVDDSLLTRHGRDVSSSDNLSNRAAAEPLLDGLPAYFVAMGTDRPKRNSGDNRHRRPMSSVADFDGSLPPVPFLIVYCNDSETALPTSSEPVTNGIWGTYVDVSSSTNSSSRSRRSPGLPDAPEAPSSDGADNELPGDNSQDSDSDGIATTITDNDQTEMHDNGQSQRRVMQSLTDRRTQIRKGKKKRTRGRKCRKRGRKGKKSRKCKKGSSNSTPEPSLNRVQRGCSRKSLHVDFNHIDWANWIISPKSFDAYYCSGVCEFDTMKRNEPSNHAIIQAIIKGLEINPEVPAPCCVPDKLMSLSVLYFDREDNVVLKVYPNMSVETCACR